MNRNRGRGRSIRSLVEYARMKEISKNINILLSDMHVKQIELSKITNIPPSTLTGYVKGTSLPIPGNIEKIAHFFGVNKSEIDPIYGRDDSYIDRYRKDYEDNYLNSTRARDRVFYDKSPYLEVEDRYYYTSPPVNFRAEYARVNEGILLDASKDLTDEELETVIDIVNKLRNRNKG